MTRPTCAVCGRWRPGLLAVDPRPNLADAVVLGGTGRWAVLITNTGGVSVWSPYGQYMEMYSTHGEAMDAAHWSAVADHIAHAHLGTA